MKADTQAVLNRIRKLLSDRSLDGPELRQALEELHGLYLEQRDQLDRIIRISDHYQQLLQNQRTNLRELNEKSARRQDKISRISDIYQQMIHESHRSLRRAAMHDALTGLPNRRQIDKRLVEETERARRSGTGFAVAMIDIDHFKRINDDYGHAAGDRALVTVGDTLRTDVREYDLCGRWGGEEFMILLADTGLDEARTVIERMRDRIARLSIPVRGGQVSVTVSAGVAVHHSPEDAAETIQRADDALRRAKIAGRDSTLTEADATGEIPPEHSQAG